MASHLFHGYRCDMELMARLKLFDLTDALAVALLFACWVGIGWLIDREGGRRPSVSVLMAEYRREWMRQFVTRQPRIFDASIIDSLRQGTSFFASTCMIAIGGGLALIGNSERLLGVTADLTIATASAVVLEVKMMVVLVFVVDGFLKFVWANRLFGYCAILMAAVPNDPADPQAYPRAGQAAEINITAARNFNRGLRSVYFALGAMGWLIGSVPLMITTALTVAMLLRREFASQSRNVMMHRDL